VRVWDLLEPSDARTFVEDDPGLLSSRGSLPLPLPCRAVRAPCGPGGPGLAGADDGRAVVHLASDRTELLAGPSTALECALSRIDTAPARAAATALRRYARPGLCLRFADGQRLDLSGRVAVMGVVNVTPDSFSDGGRFADPEAAVDQAEALLDEGADLVDVGGESTRPGAEPVGSAEERARVVPVIERLRARRPEARISIDTRKAAVAEAALDAGADLLNDVSALEDPRMAELAAGRDVPLALMHMRGEPATMQRDTRYGDLLGDVLEFLAERVDRARTAGIPDDKILIDPGIGFGKSARGNEEILRQLGSLRTLGLPILVGASRKSFVGRRTGVSEPGRRVSGSVAAAVAAALSGASVVRAHDVRASREALAIADAVRRWPEVTGER
jgi:dihydropteroate synthase